MKLKLYVLFVFKYIVMQVKDILLQTKIPIARIDYWEKY